MDNQYVHEPEWAGMEDQHPCGVPVVKNVQYWLYAEESAEGWHITGVRENGEHGLSEVHIPVWIFGKPVIGLHLNWTYDPEHPRYVGRLHFPDCIPGVDGRSLRYVLNASVERTEKPCFIAKENLLLTADGKRVVTYLVMHQRYYFVPEGVEVIGEDAFFECHMQKVFLPQSLRRIGRAAFMDTPWLLGMEIPQGVTQIGDYAFAGSSAKEICLSGKPESFGADVFTGCDAQIRRG